MWHTIDKEKIRKQNLIISADQDNRTKDCSRSCSSIERWMESSSYKKLPGFRFSTYTQFWALSHLSNTFHTQSSCPRRLQIIICIQHHPNSPHGGMLEWGNFWQDCRGNKNHFWLQLGYLWLERVLALNMPIQSINKTKCLLFAALIMLWMCNCPCQPVAHRGLSH